MIGPSLPPLALSLARSSKNLVNSSLLTLSSLLASSFSNSLAANAFAFSFFSFLSFASSSAANAPPAASITAAKASIDSNLRMVALQGQYGHSSWGDVLPTVYHGGKGRRCVHRRRSSPSARHQEG